MTPRRAPVAQVLLLALLTIAAGLPLLQAGLHPVAQSLLSAALGVVTLVALVAGVLPAASPVFSPRWPFLLGLLLLVASAWRSVYLELTLQALLLFAVYLMAGLLARHVCAVPSHRAALAGTLAGTGILAAAVASLSATPLRGPFPTSNALAGFLLLAAFCAAGLAATVRSQAGRWAWGAGVVLLAAALVGTRSRGGILAAAVGLVCFAAGAVRLLPGGGRRAAACAAAALVALAAGVALWEGPAGFGRWASLSTALTSGTAEPSFHWRQLVYTWTAGIIRDHPLLGTGPGTFPLVLGRYQQVPYVTGRYAHNAWLEFAAETGLPFTALVLLGFGLSVRRALRAIREGQDEAPLRLGIAAAVLASATHALLDIDWSLPAIALPLSLLLGAVWATGDAGETGEGAPSRLPARVLHAAAGLAAVGVFLLGATRSFAVSLQQEGRAALAQGALDDAEEAFRAARRLNPFWYAPGRWLGEVALLRGKAGEAVVEMAAAARLNPSDGESAFHLGRMLWAAGRLAEAEAALRRAIALDPASRLEFYGTLGDLLSATGRPAEALRWYRRAAELFPPSLVQGAEARCLAPGDRYLLGRILGRVVLLARREGRTAEAEAAAREATGLQAPAMGAICSVLPVAGQGSPEATVLSYWSARARGEAPPARLFARGVTDWRGPLESRRPVRVARVLSLAASETAAEIRY
ncbi:MAG: O-antigen ligase family protein, partial [candidate division NC10 bacterium]|nr:O-antigen ligase family protein [candidate division NC10 bacterium]